MKIRVTRIRYKRLKDVLVSPVLLGTGDAYQAVIQPSNRMFKILSSNGKTVVEQEFKTHYQAKRNVKKALQLLGVLFDDEVRRKNE
jgi:hypothetical protein